MPPENRDHHNGVTSYCVQCRDVQRRIYRRDLSVRGEIVIYVHSHARFDRNDEDDGRCS